MDKYEQKLLSGFFPVKLLNGKKRTRIILIIAICFIAATAIGGIFLGDAATAADFSRKNIPPCLQYPFGTDWMGRDMFARTVKGLSSSIFLGLLAASISAVIALILGTVSATLGKKADAVVTWIIDLMMGVPHIVLLILISFALGKGFWGVTIGVALTHWPSLCRVLRGEIMQVRESTYIGISKQLGKSPMHIAAKHILPHLLPQFIVGLILLFPHAIIHESAVTFLGFGLPQEKPAIGIILSESMKYLSTGKWWLAVFPGIALVLTVIMFGALGNGLKQLWDPSTAHE